MKYFIMKLDSDSYKNAPQLINWYGVQDVRLIKWESYHRLKDRQVYMIESFPETVFTDITSFPFLLVSPMVRDTIRMYGDEVVFKEIILLDRDNETDAVYYLPVMQELSGVDFSYVNRGEKRIHQNKLPQLLNGRNIFWISQKGKRHTIINLDLAESLLRRQAIGLGLTEVCLSTSDGN